MIVNAPLRFPEDITYCLLGDSDLTRHLADLLALLRPAARFAGFVDEVPAEHHLVVAELASEQAKTLFHERRNDPRLIVFPLPVDEMWSYWEFSRGFPGEVRYDGGLHIDSPDFLKYLASQKRIDIDKAGNIQVPRGSYLVNLEDEVAANRASIAEVAAVLSDERSRQVYEMIMAGEPQQHWAHYLGRVFGSIQYFDYLDFADCQVVINGGVLGGYEIPFLACHLPPGAQVHNVDPLGHAPLTAYVRPWLEAGLQSFHEHAVALENYTGSLELPFDAEGEVSAWIKAMHPEAPTVTFPCTTIDAFVAAEGLDRLDLIKLDLEGADANAIAGAANSIRRMRPQLAVSIYHFVPDFWQIPKALIELCPDYDFHLEVYSYERWETIFYAIPRERRAIS
ncbi:MAG: FkbM family methyltransferase [Alphaproteobacteria bacterium]|nr:FkbM family methyltransferase [Alphaproteobacteria bacterium]MDP6624713.1 FkbM family methyltransferase [Alphaproteobacteria bacterium]